MLDDGPIRPSPLRWQVPPGYEILQFHFLTLRMADLSPDDLLGSGQPGLFPLLPLTKGGASREVVQEMFRQLELLPQQELPLMGFTLASLVFQRQSPLDLEWLIRRFRAMHDELKDSPIFRMILQEGREEGLLKGRKEGRKEGQTEGQRQALRQTVMDLVHAHYAQLESLAARQVVLVGDLVRLRQLIVDISLAHNAQEVEQQLLALQPDQQEKN